MKSTFNFINTYFWKSIYAPFMAFVLPPVLLVILGNIFRIEYALPGIISLTILIITILIIPIALSDLKKTSAFKFLGAAPVGKVKFMIIVLGYFVIIAIVAIFVILMTLLAAFHNDVWKSSEGHSYWIASSSQDVTNANPAQLMLVDNFDKGIMSGVTSVSGFFMFFYSVTIEMVMGIAFGLLIVTLTKTPQQALTISVSLIIPTMFLSGMIISVDIIATSAPLKWLSRFIPFTYTTGNIVESITPVSHLGIYISGKYDPAIVDPTKGISGYSGAILAFKSINNHGVSTANQKLVDMILVDQYKIMQSSSKNIFDFDTDYVVRKVPEIDKIKHFMETFLSADTKDGYSSQSIEHAGTSGELAKFTELWKDFVKPGDYGFLELFFDQNNVLYEGYEKAMNIFIPIGLSIGAFWYSIRHFKWSVR